MSINRAIRLRCAEVVNTFQPCSASRSANASQTECLPVVAERNVPTISTDLSVIAVTIYLRHIQLCECQPEHDWDRSNSHCRMGHVQECPQGEAQHDCPCCRIACALQELVNAHHCQHDQCQNAQHAMLGEQSCEFGMR